MVDGYCVKCKAKGREISNPQQTKSQNGRDMVRGTCGQCGTPMVRFGKM